MDPVDLASGERAQDFPGLHLRADEPLITAGWLEADGKFLRADTNGLE
jgi:hypothetical protein